MTPEQTGAPVQAREAAAAFPLIISASRSTDIPAFYSDWFFHRLETGYSVWKNPFNGRLQRVGYRGARFIVFWSKNPRPLLGRLDRLKERGLGCYLQYTLNDYESEGFEKGVPPLERRLETFRLLVEKLGRGAVVWRFDPLVLTASLGVPALLAKIGAIAARLEGVAEKLVFSFLDPRKYRKVGRSLAKMGIAALVWSEGQKAAFAAGLVEMNAKNGWGLRLEACAEAGRWPGVERGRCVDGELILRLMPDDPELRRFLGPGGAGSKRDPGQRRECGCAKSKDVGQYDTCPHKCVYCYANASADAVQKNRALHCANPLGESIAAAPGKF